MSAANRDERMADLEGLVTCLKESFAENDVESLYEILDQFEDVLYDIKREVTQLDAGEDEEAD